MEAGSVSDIVEIGDDILHDTVNEFIEECQECSTDFR